MKHSIRPDRSPLCSILCPAILFAAMAVSASVHAQEEGVAKDNEGGQPAEPPTEQVFRGAITVEDSPIVEGSTLDPLGSLVTTVGLTQERWAGTVKLYVDTGTFDWLQWSGTEQHQFRSITDSTNYGVRWRETVVPWAGGELVADLDYDVYGGEFVERHPEDDRLATDLELRNTAPYALLSHTFGKTVSITPSIGVRYNDSRYFGSEWGTQAGITVGFSEHALYANYAHGFNLPGVYAAVQYSGWGRGD